MSESGGDRPRSTSTLSMSTVGNISFGVLVALGGASWGWFLGQTRDFGSLLQSLVVLSFGVAACLFVARRRVSLVIYWSTIPGAFGYLAMARDAKDVVLRIAWIAMLVGLGLYLTRRSVRDALT